MRVASFKTFVGLAESLIEPGLTGIVEPKGCGAMAAEPRRQLSVLRGALLLKRQ
jgi:hypothetical protein